MFIDEMIKTTWNALIDVRDNWKRLSENDHKLACILLGQLNTASGSVIVKNEAESFLIRVGYKR
jgi:hypothetical protein